MSNPVHPPIYALYENDFHKLYSIIKIKHYELPLHFKLLPNWWVSWIKNISISVSLSPKGTNNYYIFDKFNFSSYDRENEYLFRNYDAITKNELIDVFYLLPPDFLKRNLNYLFGFKDVPDCDYRIEMEIHFENPEKIFISQEPIGDYPLQVELDEITNNPVLDEHYKFWLESREIMLDEAMKERNFQNYIAEIDLQ